ncbi:protein 4.1-like isoform X1 [Acropora millepora]|uniref:protein 4.1-like isoform X1 n=1 Tax=Acropora millepora TaxID=45264 RepID=UPI001CF54440|nr:protein 4.1-like isoform X1 [Acropora millepora]
MAGTTGENTESPSMSPRNEPTRKPPRNRISCQVTLLDGTILTTDQLQKNAKGLDLMHWVTTQLNITEKEYFGLLWEDKTGEKFWLDPQKKIISQLKGGPPNFAFVVKFYEPLPGRIKTDYTRYLMCMQLRDDVNSGRLPCSFSNQAVLGSYVVQGDVGDYEAREHGDDYLDGMVFAPNQTPELLEKIRQLHKGNRGLSPEDADLQYLKFAASKLVMYGVDAHPARDEQGSEVLLGVSHEGIATYKDRLVVNRIPWPKIDYIKYKKRKFVVKSHPGELDTLTTIAIFKCPSEKAVKRLYKSCVEHHTFFRLTFPDPPPSRSASLMRMGSKFRYSDRTLYQIHKEGHPVKDQPKFNRVSSLNWSRRYQMPSLSETRIYFDEADDAKKRPMSEGDLPSKMPWYLKTGGTAPVTTAESTDTMTPEEREQYQQEMASRLGKQRREGEDVILARGAGEGVRYAYGNPDPQATVTALEEEARRQEQERREAMERERERQQREEERAKEEERERKLQEWIESEKARFAPDVAGPAYTAPVGSSERATYAMREMKREEPELVSMGVATPKTGTDTIKRAEMRVADSDTFKGRVLQVPESEKGEDYSRTGTWGGGKRGNITTNTQGHTSATLPGRGARKVFDDDLSADQDRRRSTEDLLDNHSRGKVPLVSKDELARMHSKGSSDALRLEPAQHEIKRSLKEDLNLEHEQGEGGFVRESIRRNEGFIKRESAYNDLETAPPEVTTRTMIINNQQEPTVYRQNQAPEVETQVLSFGGAQNGDPRAVQGTRYRNNASSLARSPEPYTPHSRHNNVPGVSTQRVVYDQNGPPISQPRSDGGTVLTRTIMMGGGEPTRTETIRQTTMPTEIIQKTITIEGDGNQLTAEELRDIISKHAGDLGSSEVVTTTYTTKVQEVKQTKTVTETMRVVDDDGNIIKTGDPDTDAAIMEAIQRARAENPNAIIKEVVITRTDEESSA